MKTYFMPTRIDLPCGHKALAQVTLWMTFTGLLRCDQCNTSIRRNPADIRAAIKSQQKPRKKIE